MARHRRRDLPVGRWATALVIALGGALAPLPARAHERWFTPDGPYESVEWDRLLSWPVLLAILSGAATVGLLVLLQHRLNDPLWPRPEFSQRLEPSAAAILGVQTAIAIIFAASRWNLFAPNIDLPENALGVLIVVAAVVAAFSFITGVLTRVGGLVLIGLWLLAFAFAPWEHLLEQAIFVGIAIYLIAVGRGVVRYGEQDPEPVALADRLLPVALPALRLATGTSVLTLAFTEKLINVDLGEAFLREYPHFNVAREIGLDWFTDARFIYAAGIVEATAGFALLAGYMPRVVILALWIPFNIGIVFLPPQELIGHLPILSAMYVLLVRGTEGVPPPEAAPAARRAEPRQRPAVAVDPDAVT